MMKTGLEKGKIDRMKWENGMLANFERDIPIPVMFINVYMAARHKRNLLFKNV